MLPKWMQQAVKEQVLSTQEDEDYARNGFLTDGRDEERKCAGVQAEVLLTIIDVTDQVRAACGRVSSG